jgi:hypothetical protein
MAFSKKQGSLIYVAQAVEVDQDIFTGLRYYQNTWYWVVWAGKVREISS